MFIILFNLGVIELKDLWYFFSLDLIGIGVKTLVGLFDSSLTLILSRRFVRKLTGVRALMF